MGWAQMAMKAGGGMFDAYGKQEQYKQQEELHKYNARVAEQAAADTEKDSRRLANDQRKQGAYAQARTRSLYNAAGVAGGTGSPLEVEVSQAAQIELSALDQEVMGMRAGQQYRRQAAFDWLQAKNVKRARRMELINFLMDPMQGGGGMGDIGKMFGGMGGGGGGAASSGGGMAANGLGGSGAGGGGAFMFTK